MLEELKDKVLWREFYRKLLLMSLKRPNVMYCPFDEIATCDIAPGISCAEIDCPIWNGVPDKDIMVRI